MEKRGADLLRRTRRIMPQPTDAIGVVDQLFFGQFLAIEHRPPFRLGLPAMEFEKMAQQLPKRLFVRRGLDEPSHGIRRTLFSLATAFFTLGVGFLDSNAFVPPDTPGAP